MPDYAAEAVVLVGAETAPAERGLTTVSGQINALATGGTRAGQALQAGLNVGSTAVAGLATAAVGMAAGFDEAMRNVNSIAGLSEDAFQGLEDDVLGFAMTTRAGAEGIADALYQVVSAGLSLDEAMAGVTVNGERMSEGMAVLEASTRAAEAGLANVDDVTKLVVAAMGAYSMSGAEATHITDVFLQTVNAGLTDLPALAGSLGRILPTAANLGISLEEVGYALSEMTNTGLSTEEATTRLNAVMTDLLKPSEALSEVLGLLGVQSGTELVEKFGGLTGAIRALTQTEFENTVTVGGMTKKQAELAADLPGLEKDLSILRRELEQVTAKYGEGSIQVDKKQRAVEKLTKKIADYKAELAKVEPAQTKFTKNTFNSNEELAQMFGNVRSLGGVLALLADDATLSADGLKKFSEAADGATERARAEQMKSFNAQMDRLKSIVGVLAVQLGDRLLPPLTSLLSGIGTFVAQHGPAFLKWIDGVIAGFESLPEPLRFVIGLVGGLTVASRSMNVILGATAPILRMMGISLGTISAPVTALIGGVVLLAKAWRDNWGGIRDFVTREVAPGLRNAVDGIKEMLSGIPLALQGDWDGAGKKARAGAQRVMDGIREVVENVQITVTAWLESIDWEKVKSDITTWLSDTFGKAKAWAADLWLKFTVWWESIDWEQVKSDITTWLSDTFGKAKALVTDVWLRLTAWLESIDWGQVSTDIQTAVSDAYNETKAFVGKVWVQFFAWLKSIDWEQIGQDIQTWLDDTFPGLKEWAAKLRVKITLAVDQAAMTAEEQAKEFIAEQAVLLLLPAPLRLPVSAILTLKEVRESTVGQGIQAWFEDHVISLIPKVNIMDLDFGEIDWHPIFEKVRGVISAGIKGVGKIVISIYDTIFDILSGDWKINGKPPGEGILDFLGNLETQVKMAALKVSVGVVKLAWEAIEWLNLDGLAAEISMTLQKTLNEIGGTMIQVALDLFVKLGDLFGIGNLIDEIRERIESLLGLGGGGGSEKMPGGGLGSRAGGEAMTVALPLKLDLGEVLGLDELWQKVQDAVQGALGGGKSGKGGKGAGHQSLAPVETGVSISVTPEIDTASLDSFGSDMLEAVTGWQKEALALTQTFEGTVLGTYTMLFATLLASQAGWQASALAGQSGYQTASLMLWSAMLVNVSAIMTLLQATVLMTFNVMGMTVAMEMTAISGYVNSGWLGALGSTRAGITGMQAEISTGLAAAVSAAAEFAGDFEAVGGSLMDGLRSGIMAKAGEIAAAAAQVVADAIAAARAAAAAASPSKKTMDLGMDIAAGLEVGLREGTPAAGRAAEDLVDEALASAEETAKIGETMETILRPWIQLADLVSTLAMGPLGDLRPVIDDWRNQMLYLVRALWQVWENWSNKDIFTVTAELGPKLASALEPWERAVGAVRAILEGPAGDVRPVIDAWRNQILYLLRALWQVWQNWSSKDIFTVTAELGPKLASALEPWEKAVAVVKALGEVIQVAVGPAADQIAAAMLMLARALGRVAEQLGPRVLGLAAQAGTQLSTVLTPWQDAVDVLGALAGYVYVRIEPAAELVVSGMATLARKLGTVASNIGPTTLQNAAQGATQLETILTPWQDAIDVLGALAEYVHVRVGPAANVVLDATEGLARKLARWTNDLGPQTLQDAARGAGLLETILTPWQDAIDVLGALAECVHVQVGPTANVVLDATGGLAQKLARWTNDLGPQTLQDAARGAGLLETILTPWQDAVDVLGALAEYVHVRVGPTANVILDATEELAQELARWTNDLGPQVLQDAARGAGLMETILTPWQDAVDVLSALADYVGRETDAAATSIMRGMAGLARALLLLTDEGSEGFGLSRAELAQASELAGLVGGVLTPWEQAIEILQAMGSVVARNTDAAVRTISQFMAGLARAILQLAEPDSEGSGLTVAMLTRAAKMAGLLTQVLAPWDTAIQLIADMQALKLMPGIVDKLERFARMWVDVVTVLAGLLRTVDQEALELVASFGRAVGDLASGLETAASLASQVAQLELPGPEAWDPFITWVLDFFSYLYERIQALVNDPANTLGFDPINEFGQALESVMGGLAAAANLVADFDFGAPDPVAWDAFIEWVWGVFEGLYERIQALVNDPANTLGFDPVESWGSALESIMGGLASALEIAQNFEFQRPDAGMWSSFIVWVTEVFSGLYEYVEGFRTDPEQQLGFDPVESWGSALESIMGGLSSALEIAQGFEFERPDANTWSSFIGWAQEVFDSLYAYVTTTFPQTVEDAATFDPVEAWGNALGSVMGGLSSALEVFAGLNSFVAPLQSRIDALLSSVMYVFTSMATYARSELVMAATDAVSAFGEATSSLMGGIRDAFDLFSGLATAEDATVDFIAGASTGTDTSRFMQIMGYLFAAIHETMLRFKEHVVNAVGTDWLPAAQTVYDAIEQTLSTLRDALELFTDLQGANLPTPETVAAFITSLMTLFTQTTIELGQVAPLTAQAVTDMVQTVANGPAAIANLVTEYHEVGLEIAEALTEGMLAGIPEISDAAYDLGMAILDGWNLALNVSEEVSQVMYDQGVLVDQSLAMGMLDEAPIVYDAAYHLGELVREALEDALQVGSPSKVLMGTGHWAAMGFVEGFGEAVDATGRIAAEVADAASVTVAPKFDTPYGAGQLAADAAQAEMAGKRQLEVTIRVAEHDLPAMSPAEMDRFMERLVYELGRAA